MKMENDIFEVALTKCFICGKDGNIVMNTRLTKHYADKVKEMHGKVINKHPCNKCQEYMEQGIIVISVDEEKSNGDLDNPYRTGGWWVLNENFIKEIIKKEFLDQVLKVRMMFMEHQICEDLGMFKMTKEQTNE